MVDVKWRLQSALVVLFPSVLFFGLGVLGQASIPFFARTGQGGQLFCERQYEVKESIVCQKANGLSSFFYMTLPIAATWIWDQDQNERSQFASAFGKPSVENLVVVLAGIYNTIGNLGMHGFCLESGHLFDATSMNIVLGVFLAQSLGRLCHCRIAFWIIYTLWVVATFYGPRYFPNRDFWGDQFFAQIVVLVPLNFYFAFFAGHKVCRPFVFWGLATVVSMGICFWFWLQGQNDSEGCEPRSWKQPHVIWHLNGISLYTLWRMVGADEDLPDGRGRSRSGSFLGEQLELANQQQRGGV